MIVTMKLRVEASENLLAAGSFSIVNLKLESFDGKNKRGVLRKE